MWKQRRPALMAVSSALLAIAPKCPICFLAYFGIFGVATASASVYRSWLPPLTAVWLALTVGALFFKSRGQHRYGPGLLGIVAGLAVFVGRYIFDYPALIFGGIALLVLAVVWRTRPRSAGPAEVCSRCDQLSMGHENEPGLSAPLASKFSDARQ
jgi:hypothetical protein